MNCKDCKYFDRYNRESEKGDCFALPSQWVTYQDCGGRWIFEAMDTMTSGNRPSCRYFEPKEAMIDADKVKVEVTLPGNDNLFPRRFPEIPGSHITASRKRNALPRRDTRPAETACASMSWNGSDGKSKELTKRKDSNE